ncbi:MAG TPA: MliC family protein [Gemmatimonadales bacterium]|nr:MliC family protein [Gemmatimonadales bacterium]
MLAPAVVGGLALMLAALAAAPGSGVTCAGARPRSIEALVCASPLLAALDAETARLYRLATGPREPVVAIGAKQAQRDWLAERSRCLKSAARDDDRGISLGPFAFRCADTDGLLTVIFVNSDPAFASISHRGERQTLERAASGSGARYEGPDGRMLWEHHGEATYRDGAAGPEVRCVRESIG